MVIQKKGEKTQRMAPLRPQILSKLQEFAGLGGKCVRGNLIAGESHPGLVRKRNEDSYVYYIDPDRKATFLLVADGIGGHGDGDCASQLAAQLLLDFWRDYVKRLPESTEMIIQDLQDAVKKVNSKIFRMNEALERKLPMGTTLALLILLPAEAITLHLGDSRIYMLRGSSLARLTQDHSYVNEMIRGGAVDPDISRNPAVAHIILRSVGPLAEAYPEVHKWERYPHDCYMLCSDGLTGMVPDSRILEICHEEIKGGAAKIVHSLIQDALRAGGKDNVTVVFASC